MAAEISFASLGLQQVRTLAEVLEWMQEMEKQGFGVDEISQGMGKVPEQQPPLPGNDVAAIPPRRGQPPQSPTK